MSQTALSTPGLLTVQEVLKHLRIGRTSLHALTCTGELPAVRINRAVRYDPRDVERFIERCRDGK
jgi:excisionase family DNA binding protein